jgi:hypothetical protein
MKIVQETISLQDVIDAYNDFDGQAIITKSADSEIICTVGQNECFVDGYTVIATKNLKESKDLYLTCAELMDLI